MTTMNTATAESSVLDHDQKDKNDNPNNNAFHVLMTTRKKRKVVRTINDKDKSSSRFVLCPAGCGTHVLDVNLHTHLNKCLSGTKTRELSSVVVLPNRKTNDSIFSNHSGEERNFVPPSSEAHQLASSSNSGNVFTHMMKQSHCVFSTSQQVRQRFHLDEHETLSWTNEDDTTALSAKRQQDEAATDSRQQHPDKVNVKWSTKVVLRGKNKKRKMHEGSVGDDMISPVVTDSVHLIVSSSIPSTQSDDTNNMETPQKLVRYHSRLSVPVLKSILQKSIRRRRPLPAVRVAMELMDKSLGELLRRLPIIILEDSFLHPNLPLVVWLMVAHSKNYIVPQRLLHRVLQIVYEASSCPWTDSATEIEESSDESNTAKPPVSPDDSFSPMDQDSSPSKHKGVPTLMWCNVMIQSLRLRIHYGGMAGDLRMMNQYIKLWRSRFLACGGHVPRDVLKRVVAFKGTQSSSAPVDNERMTWWDVVDLIRGREASERHVLPLVSVPSVGLFKLQLKDICVEGVDFHCSSVLDDIASDPDVVATCWNHEALSDMKQATNDSTVSSNEGRRSHLLNLLKECMWKFSSGMTLKSPLVQPRVPASLPKGGEENELDSIEEPRDVKLKNFWNECVSERVHIYMKNYVQNRLHR